MDNKETTDVETNKKKKRKIYWLLLLLGVILLSLGGFYFYSVKSSNKEAPEVVVGSFLPEGKDAKNMTDAQIATYAQKAVNASKFQMIIGSEITVQSADNTSDLVIQNPPVNAYPIAVTIKIDSTNELIYSSGAINVGQEVKNAPLDKHLEPGKYAGTATFNLYDAKTSEVKGQVQAAVTILVN